MPFNDSNCNTFVASEGTKKKKSNQFSFSLPSMRSADKMNLICNKPDETHAENYFSEIENVSGSNVHQPQRTQQIFYHINFSDPMSDEQSFGNFSVKNYATLECSL